MYKLLLYLFLNVFQLNILYSKSKVNQFVQIIIFLIIFNPQVALLDFGATRGFDESFTDLYIEVNIQFKK